MLVLLSSKSSEHFYC